MRFHYWKQFVGVVVLSSLIWLGLLLSPIDPLTMARSQNREITTYMADASTLLDRAMAATPAADPKTLKESKEHIAAALVVLADQGKVLTGLAEEKRGLDRKDMLALFVATLGGVSTLVLSWRKDLREARSEQGKRSQDVQRIVLP
jgi:hypothetical protein